MYVVPTGMKGIYSYTTVDQSLSPSDCHVLWMVFRWVLCCNHMCFCPCRKCAMIAAHYGFSDVFDNLIISLCKFTTLSSEVSLSQNPVLLTCSTVSALQGVDTTRHLKLTLFTCQQSAVRSLLFT